MILDNYLIYYIKKFYYNDLLYNNRIFLMNFNSKQDLIK